MARTQKKHEFIDHATQLLQQMRVALAEIRTAAVAAVSGSSSRAAKSLTASRVEATIARLATMPRSGSVEMMRLPAPTLAAACEQLVTPGTARASVLAWLHAQGFKGRKTSFYAFANRFTEMYRQVQAEQMNPVTRS